MMNELINARKMPTPRKMKVPPIFVSDSSVLMT